MGKTGRHSLEDHTGEVLLRLEAGSLVELFEEAGLGLAELLSGEIPSSVDPGPGTEVTLRSNDLESLLADWLNELIFRSEVAKKVYSRFQIHHLTDRELRATIFGFEPREIRTAVKAATLHRLRITQSPTGWSGTVVLDV